MASRLGLSYSGTLMRHRTSFLIVSFGVSEAIHEYVHGTGSRKLAKAVSWAIPIVRLDWLIDSAAIGRTVAIQPYLLQVRPGNTYH
jgi:hypothetical protein